MPLNVKAFLNSAAQKYDCHIIQMETDREHVHILLSYNPTVSVSKIAKYLKQYSTYYMWQAFGHYLVKVYWKR